jgi:hypothetical protein
MSLPDNIKIGKSYRFDYPKAFVTLPEYTARRNETVTVVRQLTDDEADQGEGMERMFEVRASDGWIGHAWASELKRARGES